MNWSKFPDPAGIVEFDKDTGRVSMPLWYWLNVADYVADTEANIKKLDLTKPKK